MTKTYLKGNAKKIEGQYGEFFNISLNVKELAEYANEKGYVNITMSERKEVGKFGDTHSLALNEYKPDPMKKQYKDNFSCIQGREGHRTSFLGSLLFLNYLSYGTC